MLVAILVLTCVNTALIWYAISCIGDVERIQSHKFMALQTNLMALSNRIRKLREGE